MKLAQHAARFLEHSQLVPSGGVRELRTPSSWAAVYGHDLRYGIME